ncbi:FAD-binding oxidoreductase [Corynebacterium sphenisci]|uniref:FAD-binding oxidoreductase n=1 Tax=Corynebacterium sphenisci TaxID=191493 RepID=UPI0009517410|nr:FAD-binding oxidoreductase [Corynebacterium sphenisci]
MTGEDERRAGTAVVLEAQRRTREVTVVRLHCPDCPDYAPGQHLEVTGPGLGGLRRRLSPAVPANPEGLLEFHIRVVPGGRASRILATARHGDHWRISGPAGGPPAGFGAADIGRHHLGLLPRDMLLIAGGTGLAPLRAMILAAAEHRDPPRMHLVLGARTPGGLYDLRTMTELSRSLGFLTLDTAVEDRTEDRFTWPTAFCRHHLAPLARRGRAVDVAARTGAWRRRRVLLAGSPAMMRGTAAGLMRAGADPLAIAAIDG